jgi:hypothetical protein
VRYFALPERVTARQIRRSRCLRSVLMAGGKRSDTETFTIHKLHLAKTVSAGPRLARAAFSSAEGQF